MILTTMKKRFIAAAIDLFVASSLSVLPTVIWGLELDTWIVIGAGFILYCFKDISGRSLGKRLMNVYLSNANSEEKPTFIKRILRNLFLAIWPIEAVLLLNKGRRIGDAVFRTQVR